MPIVKKLRRPCRNCKRMFVPWGRSNWVCDKCAEKVNRRKRHGRQKGYTGKYFFLQ